MTARNGKPIIGGWHMTYDGRVVFIACGTEPAVVGQDGIVACRKARASGGERGPIRLSADLQQAIEGTCRKHKLLALANVPSSRVEVPAHRESSTPLNRLPLSPTGFNISVC